MKNDFVVGLLGSFLFGWVLVLCFVLWVVGLGWVGWLICLSVLWCVVHSPSLPSYFLMSQEKGVFEGAVCICEDLTSSQETNSRMFMSGGGRRSLVYA